MTLARLSHPSPFYLSLNRVFDDDQEKYGMECEQSLEDSCEAAIDKYNAEDNL